MNQFKGFLKGAAAVAVLGAYFMTVPPAFADGNNSQYGHGSYDVPTTEVVKIDVKFLVPSGIVVLQDVHDATASAVNNLGAANLKGTGMNAATALANTANIDWAGLSVANGLIDQKAKNMSADATNNAGSLIADGTGITGGMSNRAFAGVNNVGLTVTKITGAPGSTTP